MFTVTLLGAAAAPDCNSQAVPEETNRDPGVGATGPQPGHTGENKTIINYYLQHFFILYFSCFYTCMSHLTPIRDRI